MKREIKFRAWYKVLKHWADFPQDVCGQYDMCLMDVLNNDDYEVCQFTGLTDKNGVEIYEGDIVNTYEKRKATGFGVVVYRDGGFQVYDDRDTMRDANNGHDVSVEVIGNIYQNPELLKEL